MVFLRHTCTKQGNRPSLCVQAPKSQKCQGRRTRVRGPGGGGPEAEGHQSESSPSLLNIGFLWREVDCPFLAFRWLLARQGAGKEMTSVSGRCVSDPGSEGPQAGAGEFKLKWSPPPADVFTEHPGYFWVVSSSFPTPSDKQGN